MKASELRIGNWVQAPLGEFMQVTQIGHLDNPYYIMAEIPENKGFGTNLFNPIPLTPEILEKCGFEYIVETVGYANEEHMIYQCARDGEQWFEFHPFCTYDSECRIIIYHLHQLQNLIYVLTGEELEFKP